MKNGFVIFFVFLSLTLFSNQDSCSCSFILNELIGKVERNYAGFADKVNSSTHIGYASLTSKLKESSQINVEDSCRKLISQYIAFFHDRHLLSNYEWKEPNNLVVKEKKNPEWFLPYVKRIDTSTMLIFLPNFYSNYSKNIEDTIAKYKNEILSSENLIIDVSRNAGGANFAYDPIMPFLYTNPIKYYGKKTWATKENTAVFREDIENDKEGMPAEQYQSFQDFITLLENGINTWVDHGNDSDGVYTYTSLPKKVAVLIDKNCGSSGELFILEALQSNKVTTFGQNTNGTVDYGNSMKHTLSCHNIFVKIPMVRNGWIDELGPIDREGIKPMVYIPRENTNWIQFVLDYWKK